MFILYFKHSATVLQRYYIRIKVTVKQKEKMMRKIKYLNHTVLLTSFVLAIIGCGDAKETMENSIIKNETSNVVKASTTKPFIKKYAVKSANIEYKIDNSMNMMGSTSKTTGTKKLIFSEYGSHELTEINQVEEQNIMNNPKTLKKHTVDYIKEATLYKVDFNKKNIQRTQVPALAMMMGMGEEIHAKGQKMMEKMGARPLGTDRILGYECEVWSLLGTKQCLYKGVPLKIESNVMGLKSSEVATKVTFDIAIDKSAFKLPEFPVVDAMTGETIEKSKLAKMDEQDKEDAIKNANQMAEMAKTIKKTQEKIKANPNMGDEEQKKVMIETLTTSKGMQSEFEKQKAMMPKMLTLMKSYRDCLEDADSKSDAQACDKKSQALSKKMGLNDEFSDEEDSTSWTKEGRKNIIVEINQELKRLEKSLPCIEKAKNMMDMMQCNQ